MGETNKQVRVDNWGVFFLQRLQVFFNKTDYCDLTLQFEGNVQLKVHRLVMSACTEYFSLLEHTCEVIDGNTIIMPDDLQADVILPIVNFMYTGMLEFPMSIFDKLYRTAELMNIPILIKLLDAQRKPVKSARKQHGTWQYKKQPLGSKEVDLPTSLPGRKLPIWKRKSVGTPPSRTSSPQLFSTNVSETKRTVPDPLAHYDNTPKPTRFEWPEEDLNSTFNLIDTSFNDISYSSKPLLTQDDELRASTSFDEIKYGSIRKTKEYPSDIDINDVKDYVKEQKIRSDLGECEEEDEDDPDNYLVERDNKRKLSYESSSVSSKKVRFNINEKENKEMTISVTPKNPGEMDHTKIISEVLKRYPHLVKKNKNIKLKIMAKSPVKEPAKPINTKLLPTTTKLKVLSPKESPKPIKAVTTKIVKPTVDEGPWVCKKCSFNSTEPVEFVLYYLYRKHMTDVHHEKFDSRMCKHCGHQSSKHNLLMYHQYTKHGVKPPPAYNFPKCPRCPFIALTENLLQKHLQSAHSKFDLQCSECKVAFNSNSSLLAHVQITGHSNSGRSSYDCQYCTKRFNSSSDLFGHIRASHRDEARRDGMVSIDETGDMDVDREDEDVDELIQEEPHPQTKKTHKMEVVSGVNISDMGRLQGVQPRADSDVISTEIIADMEGDNQGIVDIVVLDENQQYILHDDRQLMHTQEGLVHNRPEYILPEITGRHEYAQSQTIGEVIATSQANVLTQSMLHNSEIASTDELVMVLTDHDYNDANNGILTNDNSNIVVLYSHPVDGQQNEFITSEGKLILNPETGLLELRNENSDSQDTQIESIELIQREINNGLIERGATEAQTNTQVSQKYQDPSNQQDISDVTKPEEIDKPEIVGQVTAERYELDETVRAEQIVQSGDIPIDEPMEIDEACGNVQENSRNITSIEEVATEETVPYRKITENQMMHECVSNPLEDERDSCRNNENTLKAELTGNDRSQSEVLDNSLIVQRASGNPIEDRQGNNEFGNETYESVNASTKSGINTETMNYETRSISEITRNIDAENQEVRHDLISNAVAISPVIKYDLNPEGDYQIASATGLENSQGVTLENYPGATQPTSEKINLQLQSDVYEEIPPVENSTVTSGITPAEITSETIGDVTAENKMHANAEVDHNPHLIHSDSRHEVNTDISETLLDQNLIEIQRDEPQMADISLQNQNVVLSEGIGDATEILDEGTREQTLETASCVVTQQTIVQHQTDPSANSQDIIATDDSSDITKNANDNILQTKEIETRDDVLPQVSNVLTTETDDVEKELVKGSNELNYKTENRRQTEENNQNYDVNSLMGESVEQDKNEDQSGESAVLSSSIEYETNKESEMEESVDENSQSQDSRSSKENVYEHDKPLPNESAKISILNDWDDTEDSQQSDNPSKNVESTVNKLIDDWDDDDDEGQSIGS